MKAAIYNHQCWIKETDPVVLTETLEKVLIQSGFTILNKMIHHFSPQGFTAIWLLAESHFAVHTFPEENKTYLELSSCNEEMKKVFVVLLKNNFHT